MVAESPNPLISTGAPERRSAIWPWLVMPLVALSLYFALDRLYQVHGRHSGSFATESVPGLSDSDSR